MTDRLVTLDVEDRVATVTLSRPEEYNRVTHEMMIQLIDRLEEANDADADVLLLRAEGPHFCVGRDQHEEVPDRTFEEVVGNIFTANELVRDFEGATVAAVQGEATGFGCGIAVQSDLTLAGDTAEFGFDEVKHGFAPKIVLSYIETYVDRKDAIDLIMTGRPVSAREAERMGLVTRVLPDDGFAGHVAAVLDTLRALDASAVKDCKFFLREIASIDPEDRREYVVDAMTS